MTRLLRFCLMVVGIFREDTSAGSTCHCCNHRCQEAVKAALTPFINATKALQLTSEHDDATVAVTTNNPEP